MNSKGFILLSRGILESDVFASAKMLKTWLWCLAKANYKDKTMPLMIGKGESFVKVKRGQFVFGRGRAEKELFIDGSTIYKIMKKLENMGNITMESNNHYTTVTICNYDIYQESTNYRRTAKEQPSNNQSAHREQKSVKKVTTKELRKATMVTDEEELSFGQVATEEQPSNKQSTEKVENGNTTNTIRNKDIYIYRSNGKMTEELFNEFWALYPKKVNKKKAKAIYSKINSEKQTEIINGLNVYLSSKSVANGFIKNPDSWLLNEKWEDEPEVKIRDI